MACGRSADLAEAFHCGFLCRFIILVAHISVNLPGSDCEGISPESCSVWGPGLNPDTVLPVRYFFIQAANLKGKNLTLSPGK